jgi:hypothetical protein
MALKTDYKNYIPSTDLRQYQLINNPNGTVSLKDVTVYEHEGDLFSAGDINQTNQAVNANTQKTKSVTLTAAGWVLGEGVYQQSIVLENVTANTKVDFSADAQTQVQIPSPIVPVNRAGTIYAETAVAPTEDITVQVYMAETEAIS